MTKACQKPEEEWLTFKSGEHLLMSPETKEYTTRWCPCKFKPVMDQYDQLKSALLTAVNVFMPLHGPTGNNILSWTDVMPKYLNNQQLLILKFWKMLILLASNKRFYRIYYWWDMLVFTKWSDLFRSCFFLLWSGSGKKALKNMFSLKLDCTKL